MEFLKAGAGTVISLQCPDVCQQTPPASFGGVILAPLPFFQQVEGKLKGLA